MSNIDEGDSFVGNQANKTNKPIMKVRNKAVLNDKKDDPNKVIVKPLVGDLSTQPWLHPENPFIWSGDIDQD